MPISLVGPPPGQPFDILTQQAQLQKQQELVYALLAKELGGSTSPIVHTGGGNPFARDVVNLEPLGNLGASYFHGKQLSGINEKQQALADQVLQQRMEDLASAYSPRMTPGGAPSVMGTNEPNAIDVAKSLTFSNNPQLQQLGASLMAMAAKGAEARQPTAATTASTIRAGVNPATIGYGKDWFGFPQQSVEDINRMKLVDKLIPTGPEQQLNRVPPVAEPGAPAAGVPAASPAAGAPPAAAAPTAPPAAPGVAVPAHPETIAQAADLKQQVETARMDQSKIHDFVSTNAQKWADLIKLAQIAQVQGTTGSFGDQLNDVRKIAARIFGFSADDAAKITNFETMMKLALTPAAHAGREEVGGRYTQLEFLQFLKAGAASGITDPRTAQNIFLDGLLGGFSFIANHAKNTVPTLAATKGGEGFAKSLLVGVPDSQALGDKFISQIAAPKGAQPVRVAYDPEAASWYNEDRANPQPPVGSEAPAATSFPGFRLVQ